MTSKKEKLTGPFFWGSVASILGMGVIFGIYLSWWVPGIAWPAYALLYWCGYKFIV